ncbi:MAG: hypothetical protein RH917_20155 [Lacipirellulaceae bacterium]
MLNLKQILFMRCEETTRLASDALDRRLTWSEWLGMKGHILVCAGCKQFQKQVKLIGKWSSKLLSEDPSLDPGDAKLSELRREKIREALRNS